MLSRYPTRQLILVASVRHISSIAPLNICFILAENTSLSENNESYSSRLKLGWFRPIIELIHTRHRLILAQDLHPTIELFLPVLYGRCFVSYLCLLNIHCSELMSQYLGIGHIFPQLLLSFSLLLLCNLGNISLFDWSTTPTIHPSRCRLAV